MTVTAPTSPPASTSAPPAAPTNLAAPANQSLEERGQALARIHRVAQRPRRLRAPRFQSPQLIHSLEAALRHLRTPSGRRAAPKAAEWFLDNYHKIRRAARQVRDELPRGFIQRLPQLAAHDAPGPPRVDALAHSLVEICALVVDVPTLQRFVNAYQEVSPLTIAELWALPTLLRSAVLQHLIHYLCALSVLAPEHDACSPAFSGAQPESAPLLPVAAEPLAGIELTIRALRVLDVLDWAEFFEATSRVEAILCQDPAAVYALMDFETADRYRKVVESLAWATEASEEAVAQAAIDLAESQPSSSNTRHVGYYLIGGGRQQLEQQLRYVPSGVERLRRFWLKHPTPTYLSSLAALTVLPVLAPIYFLTAAIPGHYGLILAAGTLTTILASGLAATALQRALAKLLRPRVLPKLDFRRGLPADARTLVVIPSLLGSKADVVGMLKQIELHYLSNPDPQLAFAVLTDDTDSRSDAPGTDQRRLLKRVERGIDALNAKHAAGSPAPFHLLHRSLLWNPSEQRFMGWERKRGKLEELNRLLRGDKETSYSRYVGDPRGLKNVRFVITLDSDTELPMGCAKRLVGTLAHPLNQAIFAPDSDKVVEGYTVIQPGVESSPTSQRRTPFSRIYAEPSGLDIYTHASSELYQDLFGAGIYVGKGIYNVDDFMRSVHGRVPENSLVSHDLFEGVQGRAGLATDIRVFEDYPTTYLSYTRRLHRWLRGDWQLLPWLLPMVPSESGLVRNDLSAIDRWKIADNLRRSLTAPVVLLCLLLGWLWLPGSPALWTGVDLDLTVV